MWSRITGIGGQIISNRTFITYPLKYGVSIIVYLQEDLSDLEERFAECCRNPEQYQEIAKNARTTYETPS